VGIEDTQPFFLLGAAKSGTTTLYASLERHPDLRFSDPKEPIFFEAQFERGLPFYRDTYFRDWRGERLTGDARAHNLFLPFVPERIHALFPRAQLIAILRDPVDRAHSEWWHRYSRGRETRDFAAALEANVARIEAGITFEGERGARDWVRGLRNRRDTSTRFGLYLDCGYYARQLRRYLDLYPREQLRVVLYDDLVRDPAGLVRSLWTFLGLDPDAASPDTGRHNPAQATVRTPLAAHLVNLRRPAGLGRLLPGPLRRRLQAYLRGQQAKRPAIDPPTERWLPLRAPQPRAGSAVGPRAAGLVPAPGTPHARRLGRRSRAGRTSATSSADGAGRSAGAPSPPEVLVFRVRSSSLSEVPVAWARCTAWL